MVDTHYASSQHYGQPTLIHASSCMPWSSTPPSFAADSSALHAWNTAKDNWASVPDNGSLQDNGLLVSDITERYHTNYEYQVPCEPCHVPMLASSYCIPTTSNSS